MRVTDDSYQTEPCEPPSRGKLLQSADVRRTSALRFDQERILGSNATG